MENPTNFEHLLNNDLFSKPIAQFEPNLLEKARVSNKELTISNLYAYFLNPNENHGLGDIFLDSLIELIAKKSKTLVFNSNQKIEIYREVQTTTEKFIDLVLIDEDNNAIIIENKLFAQLYNKLDDYFNYVKASNKVGIVLSVYNLADEIKGFTTITHQELYEAVEKRFYLRELSITTRQQENYLSFIEILKKHYLIMENIKDKLEFFKTNENSLARLNLELNQIKTFIMDRVKLIAQKVFEDTQIKIKVKKPLSFEFYKDKVPYITYVCFPDSGEGFDRINLVLCIAGNKKLVEQWFSANHSQFDSITTEYKDKGFNCLKRDHERYKSWALTYYKDIPIYSDDLEKTFKELENSLKNDWCTLFDKLPNAQSNKNESPLMG